MIEDISGLGLSYMHKLSVLRLAVDLIKADNQIFGEEVAVLTQLQNQFGLSQQDVDGIHYITLQQAIEALKDLDGFGADLIVKLLSEIMCVDNDIDYEENILLTSIKMSISPQSKDWCKVISAINVMDETSQRQIMYLEDAPSEIVHKVFDDKYDRLLITKSFTDLGLDFFYLPDAIGGLDSSLLQSAMKYLVPSSIASALDTDDNDFNPSEFFYFLLSRYNLSPESIMSHSFLLLKIRDSYFFDDANNLTKAVDFLVIDLSSAVKKRIYAFVSNFNKKGKQIPYEGCYKILCDYLSSEAKVVSHILLDARYDFHLKDSKRTPVVFESSPQSRTFFLLMLKYGEQGIRQHIFEDASTLLDKVDRSKYISDSVFDIGKFKEYLLGEQSDCAKLIFNTIVIYSSISTKDVESVKFLGYIEKIIQYRSSLKHYLNKGFAELDKLSDPSDFTILFDSHMKVYRLPVNVSKFVYETTDGNIVGLSDSELWQHLV